MKKRSRKLQTLVESKDKVLGHRPHCDKPIISLSDGCKLSIYIICGPLLIYFYVNNMENNGEVHKLYWRV